MLMCLEGPNGVGKSTLARTICLELRSRAEATIVSDTRVHAHARARSADAAAYRAGREIVAAEYRLAATAGRFGPDLLNTRTGQSPTGDPLARGSRYSASRGKLRSPATMASRPNSSIRSSTSRARAEPR